ncbi:MAG: hypothetical protein HZB46_18900 [Solirubrobacterales bacterium]|nr:hypothetical protein [Solirubrobacterales bacterium]
MVKVLSLLLVLGAGFATGALAAQRPATLPTVARALGATDTTTAPCATATRAGTGVASTSYRAPMSGYATFRVAGKGDWDLAVRDVARRGLVGASQGFGGDEVVQSWVQAGQRLRLLACRRDGAAGTARATVDFVDVAPPKAAPVPQLLRVYGTPQQTQRLEEAGLDVTHNVTKRYADVLVAGAAQRDLVKRTGLRSALRIADFDAYLRRTARADGKAAMAGPSNLPSGRQTYRGYEDIQAELKAIVEQHGDVARPVVIGKSYQGRELQGVEVAKDVRGDDGRPTFLLVALHHAREWPSAEAAMEFLWTLVKQQDDPRIASLLARERIVVVPLINPDGYVTSRSHADYDPALAIRDNLTGGEEQSIPSPIGNLNLSLVESIAPPGGILTYRRKNCAGAVPDPSMPCDLQWGVDPNRNYGQFWGGPGSSPDPTSQSYHGPGPWSEPETQAVHQFSATHNITNIITLHNVAALVLRPPGAHDQGKAPDEARLKEIGDAMATATGYTSQYGFELYDTTGTTEDWNYAATGSYGYTIEIGPPDGEFHMPYQVGFIDEWEGKRTGKGGLREALLLGAEAAATQADHSVIEGTAPAGATLRIRKSFMTRTSEYCTMGAGVPLLNPAFFEENLGVSTEVCPEGRQPARDVPDGLDMTTKVPASGRFTWHVTPSTRPFVGQSHEETTIATEPTSTQQIASTGDTSSSQLAGTPAEQDAPDHQDVPITVPDDVRRVVATVAPTAPTDDYDLVLYRDEGGKLTEVGSSGNPAGVPETVDLTGAQPGRYVLRVNDYLAPTDTGWSGTVEQYAAKVSRVEGVKEAWTLTCERDGQVLEQRDVVVDRGQVVSLDLGCGGAPQGAAAPSAAAGGEAGAQAREAIAARPTSGASKGKAKAKAKARKKPLTKAQKRRLARCLAKAKKVKGAKKRAAAKRRCAANARKPVAKRRPSAKAKRPAPR